jgi:hypothetical protein
MRRVSRKCPTDVSRRVDQQLVSIAVAGQIAALRDKEKVRLVWRERNSLFADSGIASQISDLD